MNNQVIELAIKMCKKAHAPFSNYRVGAAAEIITGEIVGGCNVESSSYSLTCCAERVALFKAITEGYCKFKSMAIATKNTGMPCGACRQVIWELCGNIPIYICNMHGLVKTIFSSELLPDAFDKNDLQ
tara:strand:+ start:1936 stop:2319 length:384 start_codon:yes stop_codon:yes gene_type:complete